VSTQGSPRGRGQPRGVRSYGPRRLWTIRHAESEWNVAGLIQGQTDLSSLTDRGHAQARALATRFRVGSISALVSSDLRRGIQTAMPLGAALGLPVHLDQRLRERSFGVLEGQPTSALTSSLSGIKDDRVVDPDCRPPGGESITDLWWRAAAFLSSLAYGVGDVVAVVHGGSLRALQACSEGTPPNLMTWTAQPNCAIQRLDLQPFDSPAGMGAHVKEEVSP
jgi:probable phosphoglycerate mutase